MEEAPQAGISQPDTIPPADPVTTGEGADVVTPSLPVSESPRLDATHPAIELAQKHPVAAGKPREGLPRYYTPPPFDVFAKKKR